MFLVTESLKMKYNRKNQCFWPKQLSRNKKYTKCCWKVRWNKKVYLIQFVTKFINLHNTIVAADVINKRLFTTYIYQKNILSGLNRHSASTIRKTVRWIAQSMCSLNLQIQNSINLLYINIEFQYDSTYLHNM